MKRVRHATSAASAAKRSSAAGSRSMAMSSPPGPEAVGDQARVAAAAERAVDGDLARLRVEEVDELAGEDRDVGGGHVNQHGRRRR